MIYKSFNNWENEKQLFHPVINNALSRLLELTKQNLDTGRVDVDGELVYINVMEYEIKENHSLLLAEKHKEYIDIHVVLEGIEEIGFLPYDSEFSEEKAYDEADDYALYQIDGLNEQRIVMEPGYFAVFTPTDIHRPSLGKVGQKNKKMVLKLHMSLFS